MIGKDDLDRELFEFWQLFEQPEQVEALFRTWGIDPDAIADWSKDTGKVNAHIGDSLGNQSEANAISFLSGFITGWRLCLEKND